MKPAPFDLARPATLPEALEMLRDDELETRPLAGGQSLVPLMNFRLSRPDRLVSLNRISELALITTDDADLVVGSMVRQRVAEFSPTVAVWCPLLRQTLGYIAHPAIRNRGTVGGSIAHADPSAELPALAVALDARLMLRSSTGARAVGGREFFLGPYETALQPGEVLIAMRLRRAAATGGHGIAEVTRRHGDFALAGAIATVTLRDNRVTEMALVFFGVGSRPVLAHAPGHAVGAVPTPGTLREVSAAAAAEVQPFGDLHASSRFRAHLTGVVAHRALLQAVARARTPDTRPARQPNRN